MRLVIGKYFGYNTGGAEKSTEIYFAKRRLEYKYIFFNNLRHYEAQSRINILNNSIDIKLPIDWKYFPFTEALLNMIFLKQRLLRIIDEYEITEIYFYGFYSVFSGLFPVQDKFLFIRDEYGAGHFPNYHIGFAKYLYSLYQLIEFLPRKKCFMILSRVRFKEIIYNSEFICQSSLIKLNTKKSTILYPEIDENKLQEDFRCCKVFNRERYITFVGDTRVKGLEIFRYLAVNFPEYEFLLVGKVKLECSNVSHIEYAGIADVLAKTKILLVPSQWNEAYGRVVREAAICNVLTLASSVGGIPEAAGSNTVLVSNYRDKEVWRNLLSDVLEKGLC